MAPYGTIKKCDIPVNFHWGIEIPFFSNDTLDVHWKTYKVTAAVAHLGMDAAGHCRSLMKVKMNATADQPYMFLLTDDWEQATPVWKEPAWFIRNISCFWLCDCDHMDLHDLPSGLLPHTTRPPDPASRPVGASELLSLFVDGTTEDAGDT
jgi:hypothetical protein